MSNVLEELLVGLGYEFDGEQGEQFKKQTEVITSTINKLAVAAGVALGVLTGMAGAAAKDNDELTKTARTLDENAESLAKWKHAADIAGVGGDNVIGMLANLREQAQGAVRDGSGPFRAFADLGVDFEGIANGSVKVTDSLEDIIEKAKTLDRATAQSALREIGVDVKFLDFPLEELQRSFAEVEKFGGVTDQLGAKSEEFNDTLIRAKQRFGGLGNELADRLLPVLTRFLDKLIEGLEWMNTTGLPMLDKVVAKFGGWENVLIALGSVVGLGTFATTLGSILGTMNLLKAATMGVGTGVDGATKKAGKFGKLMGKLGAATAVIGAGIAGWKIGEAISDELSIEQKDSIGRGIARTLAFFGNDEAQAAIKADTGEEALSIGGIVGNMRPETEEERERIVQQLTLAQPMMKKKATPQQPTEDFVPPSMFAPATENASVFSPPVPPPTVPPVANSLASGEDKLNPQSVASTPIEIKSGAKTVKNSYTFNGMKQEEIENMLAKREAEDLDTMSQESNDSIVR